MKNLTLAVLALFLVSTSVFAEDKDFQSHLYVGIGGGIDNPVQNWDSAFALGGSAEAVVGYAFDKNFAAQVQVDNELYSATIAGVSTTSYELRPLAEFKASVPIEDFSPYILVGAGTDTQFVSASGTSVSQTNFDAVGGLGAQYNFKGWSIFAEGKYNLVFPNNVPNVTTVQDIPVEAGVLVAL